MKLKCIVVLLFVIAVVSSSKAQTSSQISISNDPLKDSVDKYFKLGLYGKAVPFARQQIFQLESKGDMDSESLAMAYNSLGKALMNVGSLDLAEPNLFKALEIRRKKFGENHLNVAITLNDLGAFYYYSGKYTMSEPYYLKALEIRKIALGPEDKEVALTLNNLGILYMDMGNYPKAEPCYEKALQIRIKVLGSHPYVADSYNNLGLLYYLMGSYSKVEPLYKKALQIRIEVLGENHPDVAASYVNLGELYMDMKEYQKAEFHYLKGIEIWKRELGDDHPDLAISYNSLGILRESMGKFALAEELFQKAILIRKKSLGESHIDLGFSYLSLAELYQHSGQVILAEKYFLEALKINQNELGKDHPYVGQNLHKLGMVYLQKKDQNQAERYLLNGWNNALTQLGNFFPFFSQEEKARFLNKQEESFEEFKSFLVTRQKVVPELAGVLYDQQLFTKAILLNSQVKWKQRIKNSNDSELKFLFENWEITRATLSKLYMSVDSTERAGIDSLERKAEKFEKVLSTRSESFAKLAERKQIVWKEVQDVLQPNDACIEMIRISKLGSKKIGGDLQSTGLKRVTYGLTDTVYYAALVIKPGLKSPTMVLLTSGEDMETKGLVHYKRCIESQSTDTMSYRYFWKAISNSLGPEVKRVYFSPDGVYHSVNLNTLYNTKTKKYLIDELDIRVVTVTKDLVELSGIQNSQTNAVLIGHPAFYYSSQSESTDPKNMTHAKDNSTASHVRWDGELVDLPGTKDEVDKISDMLKAGNWTFEKYTEGNAREENLKQVNNPRLVHLATHGYFQSDSSGKANPLVNSGLFLASAGNTINGKQVKEEEDGIMTAYEAMNLDLDQTELVVLSACETGLGEVKNGEGVFGLQRAFKVAGAKSIIMSLWKVDDEASQELMVGFYKNWLSGGNKRTAFLKAQKELKSKYKSPYYWGAFVMVGE